MRSGGVEQPIRAAELVAALSIATDLGTGQPLEHAVRSAVLAVRLGELAGASADELADTYYVALLHASGCTSNGHEAGQLFGDDIAHRAAFYLIDPTKPDEVLEFYRAFVGLGRPPEVRAKMLEQAIAEAGPRARESLETMCEVAQRFAAWLGLRPSIQEALEYVFARWDGLGLPAVAGEQIPLSIRLLHVAKDASLFLSAAGPERACAVLEERSGAAYEPRLAELAVANLDAMLGELDESRMWEYALAIEPSPPVWLHGEAIEKGFATIAAITGLKTPWLREHCTAVAELAEAAAWRANLDEDDVTLLRRAALAHDLGRVGVPNSIWEKPDRARVRRVGARSSACTLQRTRLRAVLGARADRPDRRRSPRAPRRLRLPPRRACARTRSGWPASSPRPTATSRCAKPVRTGRRSMRRAPRPSCYATRARAGSTRMPSRPCSRRPAIGSRSARASCPPG